MPVSRVSYRYPGPRESVHIKLVDPSKICLARSGKGFQAVGGVLRSPRGYWRIQRRPPQLIAYLRLMSRASRNYETDAWVEYDTAFRRRAANCGSLDWGTIDSGLYNEIFTGRARPIKRCSYCVVDTHALEECPYAPKGWSQQESGASHESRARTTQRTPGAARGVGRLDSGRSDAVEISRLFNEPGAGCSYPECRYAHLFTGRIRSSSAENQRGDAPGRLLRRGAIGNLGDERWRVPQAARPYSPRTSGIILYCEILMTFRISLLY